MAASTPFAVPSGRRTGTAEYYEKDAARRRRLFHLEKGIRKRRPVGRRFLLLPLFRKIVLEQGVFDRVPVFVEELDGAGFTAVLNIGDGSFRAGLDAWASGSSSRRTTMSYSANIGCHFFLSGIAVIKCGVFAPVSICQTVFRRRKRSFRPYRITGTVYLSPNCSPGRSRV